MWQTLGVVSMETVKVAMHKALELYGGVTHTDSRMFLLVPYFRGDHLCSRF